MKNTRAQGMAQESRALSYLKHKGLQLVQRNFSTPFGEIDLIMLHPPSHLVFVEVRYRNTSQYGGALASVTREKQRRIKRTAAAFLQRQSQFGNLASRFDVIALSARAQHDREIEWIRNAFY